MQILKGMLQKSLLKNLGLFSDELWGSDEPFLLIKYFLVLDLSVPFDFFIIFRFLKCCLLLAFVITFCFSISSSRWFVDLFYSLSLYFLFPFVSSPKGLFLHWWGEYSNNILTITCMLTIHYWWTDSFI